MNLFDLVENICALLFQKWPIAFSLLDRRRHIDRPRDIDQRTADAQRRGDYGRGPKVETQRFRQLQYRDAIRVPRGNQLRDLVIKLDLSLQNVEPRNSSGFETYLFPAGCFLSQ